MSILKKISFKAKVLILLMPAILTIFGLSAVLVNEAYVAVNSAKQVGISSDYFADTAKLVNGFQIERRLSNGAVSGSSTVEELQKHRAEKVDAQIEHIRKMFSKLQPEDIQKFEAQLLELEQIRKYVDSGEARGSQIAMRFGALINNIFTLQRERASAYDIASLTARLNSLIIFQMARENAGGLRQSVVSVLTSKNPPTANQISRVMETMTGVSMNVNSPAAYLSEEGRKKVETFLQSSEWQLVNKTVREVLDADMYGNYSVTRDEYYAAIVVSMKTLSEFVMGEISLVTSSAQAVEDKEQKRFWFYLVMSGAILFLIIALSYVIFSEVVKTLESAINTLSENAKVVGSASEKVSSSSLELSEASNEQASALEETSASIQEMSTMTQRNSESAGKTAEVAQASRESAEKGQQVVGQMMNAMDEINKSNTHIMESINESNKRISEIVQVISEIGNKTKVINDIVFQTKLLSFNASVEAARAGEHGKGFAVVAEEVGNLAEMSGKSSKEISDMLEASIKTVEGIIHATNKQISSLVLSGKEKVEAGNLVAKECQSVLGEIVENISKASEWANDIARASQEQAQGIQEITSAMNQLDQVTQTNAATSEEAAVASRQLSSQATSLVSTVSILHQVVYGQGHQKEGPSFETQNSKSFRETNEKHNVVELKPKNLHDAAPVESYKKVASDSFVSEGEFEEI